MYGMYMKFATSGLQDRINHVPRLSKTKRYDSVGLFVGLDNAFPIANHTGRKTAWGLLGVFGTLKTNS